MRRGDAVIAYQLAVVVDDAAAGITHVVRGHDIAASTATQVLIQRALGLPAPRSRTAPASSTSRAPVPPPSWCPRSPGTASPARIASRT